MDFQYLEHLRFIGRGSGFQIETASDRAGAGRGAELQMSERLSF